MTGSIKDLSSPGIVRVIAVLKGTNNPMSVHEISEAANVSMRTFKHYVDALISAGVMHVARYDRNTGRGPFMPMYSYGKGDGTEPKKPEKLTQPEICRNWRLRSGYNEYRRSMDRLARPDPILRAFLGMRASA